MVVCCWHSKWCPAHFEFCQAYMCGRWTSERITLNNWKKSNWKHTFTCASVHVKLCFLDFGTAICAIMYKTLIKASEMHVLNSTQCVCCCAGLSTLRLWRAAILASDVNRNQRQLCKRKGFISEDYNLETCRKSLVVQTSDGSCILKCTSLPSKPPAIWQGVAEKFERRLEPMRMQSQGMFPAAR